MRAVLQRVTQASVEVEGSVVGAINKGVCVLVGITHEDGAKDIEYIVRKVLNLRVFDDEDGSMWKKSVKELNLGVLSGSKPDFHLAMKSAQSKEVYQQFLDKLRADYRPDMVQDGSFGAMMNVKIQNDGPVTIILDSRDSA
ncbi:D-tyrosyl-tRNA(Tyr) deacylase [Tieghemiomyces parasiticus]|uniref:D-aminoacyl-tRNA deacylase n=1 Tax=Tieghemiomyces parasiticus TaxID=78921 RepID=A0A9W8A8I6_9FUNG|nr:D-tyrosyl-tRNA(Tyr) deacylase [Tieghemiomyces parasiticus]